MTNSAAVPPPEFTVIRGGRAIMIDDRTLGEGDVVVSGPRIVESAPAGHVSTRIVDATGCVITPGLINAHHHLLQSAFRTLPGTRFVPMAQWLTTMAGAYAAARTDPELAGLAASVGMAESLLNGVTTVADHHLTWPRGVDPVAMARATATAARAVGGRLAFVRGTARDNPEQAAESVAAIVEALLPGIAGGVSADGMLQLAVGPSGVHADGPETFAALATVAADYGLRRRTQANEQIDVAIALENYGRRPLELLDEWGWLAPDVTVAHLCDISESEISLLADSGVTATHAPGCDIPMGWGVAPVARLRERGVETGLGTSGGGSNDAGHLLADARLAMQVSGLIGEPLAATDLLAMATMGSAAGLGRTDLGRLTCGAAADLCIWDCSDVHDAGVADPVAGLLWASPGRRPRDVMVAGRWVVRDGLLVTQDSREIAGRLHRELATRSR
ncbi:MAG: amidohydrolase family protein [Gordonia sp. (in: high G+C Gram-positive bacteria)]